MYCSKCGNQLQEGARFCGKCGAPVTGKTTQSPQRTELPVSRPKTSGRAVAITPANTSNGATTEWHPASTPELGGPARRIMTNRGLIKYILFTVLTLGIYGYYFVYKMAQDMNTMCADDDQKTGGLIAFILLNIVTLGIYGIYWWYRIANRVYLNAPRYGIAVAEKGSSFLLWYLLGVLTFGIAALVGFHTVIRNVNSLAAAYNRTHGFA